MPSKWMTRLFAWMCALWALGAHAQGPMPAARAYDADFGLGYAYTNAPATPSTRVSMHGFDASLSVRVLPILSLKGDLGYARSGNLLGTSDSSTVWSFLAGPVYHFSTIATASRFDPYVQALFGGARVSGPIPVQGGILVGGWATHFAWAVGGGFNYWVSDSIALRGGVDYLMTSYYSPSLATQSRSNVRATASVVYAFRPWWKRRN